MKQFLEDEQKSRKELERIVRKLAKQKNDCAWEDCSHWKHPKTRPHPVFIGVNLWRDAGDRLGVFVLSVLCCVFIVHSKQSWTFPLWQSRLEFPCFSFVGARCDPYKPVFPILPHWMRLQLCFLVKQLNKSWTAQVGCFSKTACWRMSLWTLRQRTEQFQTDKTTSLLLPSLQLDIEKYEAIRYNKWFLCCYFFAIVYFYLLQGTPEEKLMYWVITSMCLV